MSSSPTRRILYIAGGALLFLLLVGGLGRWLGWWGVAPEGLAVEVEAAERRTVTQVVTAFGRTQPEVEVTISPDVSGEIIALPVQEGDRVQQGDLLARINPDAYQAQVEQMRASLSGARARLEQRRADMLQAERIYERQKELYAREVISEADYLDAQTAYKVAQSNLKAARFEVQNAEARLEEAQKQLGKTSIQAPMSGTISRLNVEAGERVVGTSQMAGTEMMRIARLSQMEVVVDVNENDVVNVALRDTASISVDAYPEESLEGVVMEIANSARVSGEGTQEQVTNFPVKIRVTSPHNLQFPAMDARPTAGLQSPEGAPPATDAPTLRPGMSSTVDIFTQTVKDAVAVPIQAVTVRDFNKLEGRKDAAADDATEDLRKVVFVAQADTVEMVEVETGIADDTHIVIASGLEPGARVVTGPYSAISRELSPGAAITVTNEGAPGAGPDAALASNE
ncbi:efflux RND transporter periplasmic adaptor subunit [Salisaeta longa]|uniref:efflux RND transporter periplasmic adaptor subunit n=1 Tax=Salisaeta longa TaxID=503170 RepID=UPI0003B452E2|nr:efflux RND transporter periplasmic adaptor subunit [Salisaeta longa]